MTTTDNNIAHEGLDWYSHIHVAPPPTTNSNRRRSGVTQKKSRPCWSLFIYSFIMIAVTQLCMEQRSHSNSMTTLNSLTSSHPHTLQSSQPPPSFTSYLSPLFFFGLAIGSSPILFVGAADITDVDVRLYSNINTTSTSILTLFTPPFVLGTYGPYTLSSPLAFTNASVQFKLQFSTSTSIRIDRGPGSTTLDLTASQVTNNVWTKSLDLTLISPASNTFRITSTIDFALGNYTFILTRNASLLTGLSFKSLTTTIDSFLTPTLDPAFTAGTMYYTVNFYYSSTSCFIKNISFSVPETSSFLTSPNAVSNLPLYAELSTKNTTSTFTSLASWLGISWTISKGNNFMRIKVPTDGYYTINLYRYAGYFTNTSIPTYLYSGQLSSPISFAPAITTGALTITPNASRSGIIFSPPVLSWATTFPAVSMTITVPQMTGVFTVNFTIGGAAARQFSPISPIAITVRPQDTFEVGSVPSQLYATQWSPIPLTLAPLAAPDVSFPNGVGIHISSTAGPNTVNPDYITFDVGSTVPQTFLIQGTDTTDLISMDLTFTIDPLTPYQFTPPQPISLTIIPLGTFVFNGFVDNNQNPITFAGGQPVPISVYPTYPNNDPAGATSVTLSLLSKNGSFTPSSLTFNGQDATPQVVYYSAPNFFLSTINSIGNDTISVVFTAGDTAHYFVPTPWTVPVLCQSYLLFQNPVASLQVQSSTLPLSAYQFTFGIQAATQPIALTAADSGVDVIVQNSLATLTTYGTIAPTNGYSLDVGAFPTWNTWQSFTYTAPVNAIIVPLYTSWQFIRSDGSPNWQYMNNPNTVPSVLIVKALASMFVTSTGSSPSTIMYTNQQVQITVQIAGLPTDKTNIQVNITNTLGSSSLIAPNILDFSTATPTTTNDGQNTYTRTFTITVPSSVPSANNGNIGVNVTLYGLNSNLVSALTPGSSFNFTVLPQATLTTSGYPTKLYTNQQSSTMTIAFSAPTSNQLGLAVKNVVTTTGGGTILTQPGTVTPPISLSVGAGYSTPVTFVYTAGAYPGTITLSVALTKTDAPHYNVVPASIVITILDRGTFVMPDLPAANKVQCKSVNRISISLSQSPVVDTTYTGSVTLVATLTGLTGSTGGSLDVTSITFNSANWNIVQTITLTAPNVYTSFTLSWSVSGSNSPQFIVPSPLLLTALAFVTIPQSITPLIKTVNGIDYPLMYTTQLSDPIVFSVTGAASPSVKLQITLFPSTHGGTLSYSLLDLSSLTSPSSTVSCTYTAPIDVPAAGTITLNFLLIAGSGPNNLTDLAKFDVLNPASMVIQIAQQSSLTFSSPFNSLLVFDKTGVLTFTPLVAPKLGGLIINLIIQTNDYDQSQTVDDGSFISATDTTSITGDQLIWPTGSTTSLSFRYLAGGNAASSTMSFSFEPYNSNNDPCDIYHFALPQPFTFSINPLGTYAIIAPTNIYAGQTIRISYAPSLLPLFGITLSITPSVPAPFTYTIALVTNGVAGTPQTGGSIPLSWNGTNAAQMIDVSVNDPGLATTAQLSLSYANIDPLTADSVNLPAPLNSNFNILPNGGWILTSIPGQIKPGGSFKLTIQPSATATIGSGASVSLSLAFATSTGSGTITPSVLTWTSISQSQSFTFSPSSNAALSSGTIPLTFTQTVVGGTTSLVKPKDFSVIVLAPISLASANGNDPVPTFLYSNQVSTALAFTPSSATTIGPTFGLTITFYSSSTASNVTLYPNSVVPICKFKPTSISFINNNPLSFQILAPTVTTSQISLTTTISFILSDLSSGYFTTPTTLTLTVYPQSQLQLQYVSSPTLWVSVTKGSSVTTNNTYGLTTLVWTIQQLDISDITLGGGFVLNLALTSGGGSLNVTSVRFYTGFLQSFAFSYTAPLDIQTGVTITFFTTGPDAAHFAVPPPIVINTLGPLLFPGCTSTTQNVIVSGATDMNTYAYYNGLYTVAAPINQQPHYILTPASGGGQLSKGTVHLFFLPANQSPFTPSSPPTGSTYPSGNWVIDYDTSGGTTIAHVKALYTKAYSPILRAGGVGQDSIVWYTYGNTPVPSLLVSCGVDCLNLGTPTSLESFACFNGINLLTNTPSTSSCSITCGHYVAGIEAACSPLPSLWKPAISIPVLAMKAVCYGSASLPTSTQGCSYARTLYVMTLCGISFSTGDGANDASGFDLMNMMVFPSGASSNCATEWTNYFAACISSTSLPPASPAIQFNKIVLTQTYSDASTVGLIPFTVNDLYIYDIYSDHFTIAWSPMMTQDSVTPRLTYCIEQSLTNTLGADTPAPSSCFSNTLSTSTTIFTTYDPSTNVFFHITATPSSGVGAGTIFATWSPVKSVTTAPLSLSAPNNFAMTTLTYTPATIGQSPFYSTVLSWSPVPPTTSGGTVLYRVTLSYGIKQTTQSTVLYGPPYAATVQFYVGTSPSFTLTHLVPYQYFQVNVAAQDVATGTRFDQSSSIAIGLTSNSFASIISPDVVAINPVNPTDISTTVITLSWPIPASYCNLPSITCTSLNYEVQYQSISHATMVGLTSTTFNSATDPSILNSYTGVIAPGTTVGQGLSFQTKSSLVKSFTNDTLWLTATTSAPSALLTYSFSVPDSTLTTDAGYIFRVRGGAVSSSTSKSPWSPPMFVTMPPALPTMVAPLTIFDFISVNYQTAIGSWNPNEGILTPTFAPLDQVHFQFDAQSTASGVTLPSPSFPSIHFYFDIATLIPDPATPGNVLLTFDYTTSVNGLSFAPATIYNVFWQVHHTGSGVTAGYGWSTLQPVPPTTINIPDAPPALIGIQASDSAQQFSYFGAGQRMTFVFSKVTNKPTISTLAVFNNYFSCTPSSAMSGILSFSTSWTNERMDLSILTAAAGSSSPPVGVFTCSIKSSGITSAAVPDPFINSGDSLSTLIDKNGLTATLTGSLFEGQLTLLQPYISYVNILADSTGTPIKILTRSTATTQLGIQVAVLAVVQITLVGTGGGSLSYVGSSTPTKQLTFQSYTYGQLIDTSVSPFFNRISYTPKAHFTGIDVLNITVFTSNNRTIGSFLSETVMMTIKVTPVNHAPTITSKYRSIASPFIFPSGTSLSNPIYLDTTLFTISDQDDPTGTKPVTITVSGGSSQSCIFTLTLTLSSDISCTAGVGIPVANLKMSGPLNSVLAGLSTVSLYEPNSGNDGPTSSSQFILIHVDDYGSGIPNAVNQPADAIIYYQPNPDVSVAPNVLSTSFTQDYSEIAIKFDTNVRLVTDTQSTLTQILGGYSSVYPNINAANYLTSISPASNYLPSKLWSPTKGPNYNCATIFDSATITRIGAGATCWLNPYNTLHVQLGYQSTISPTTALTFGTAGATGILGLGQTGSISSSIVQGSYLPALPPGSVQAYFPNPTIYLTGATNLSLCDDLVLRAQVVNTSLHAGLVFHWASINANLNNMFPDIMDVKSDTLIVPSGMIRPSELYKIQVYVLNTWTGQRSNIATNLVFKYANPIPTISVNGVATRIVGRGDLVSLSVNANYSRCLTDLSVTERQLGFSWSITGGITLDPTLVSTRNMAIQPFTLTSGTTYTLVCTTYMVNNPSWSNQVQITLVVLPSPLQVFIEGGKLQTVSSARPITLQAQAWDSEASSTTIGAPFSWQWSCQILYPSNIMSISGQQAQTCYYRVLQKSLTSGLLSTLMTTYSNVASNSTVGLILPTDSLFPGSYVFTATVSKSGQVSGSFNVTVFVHGITTAPSLQVTPSSAVVNPTDPLILSAIVPPSSSNVVSSRMSYLWTVSNTEGRSVSLPAFYDPSITTGHATPTLTINSQNGLGLPTYANIFPPGARFRLRCTMTHELSNTSMIAESEIQVTNPPTGGSFTVTPAVGVTGVTLFTFSSTSFQYPGSASSPFNNGMTFLYYIERDGGALYAIGTQPGSPVDSDYLFLPPGVTTAQNYRIILKIRTDGGVYSYYTNTITLSPHPTLGGSPLASLSSAFLSQRLKSGQDLLGYEATFSAYGQQASLDLSTMIKATPIVSSAFIWPSIGVTNGSPFSFQARCNIVQNGLLSSVSGGLLAASTVTSLAIANNQTNMTQYNTISSSISAPMLTSRGFLQSSHFFWFTSVATTFQASNPGLFIKTCVRFMLSGATLTGESYDWTNSMLSSLSTNCLSGVSSILSTTSTTAIPWGAGGKLTQALFGYGCGVSSVWPLFREKSVCLVEKQQLIQDLLLIVQSSYQIRQIQVSSGASGLPTDTTFMTTFMNQLNLIGELHFKFLLTAGVSQMTTTAAAFGGATSPASFTTPIYTYPDCVWPMIISRDSFTNQVVLGFPMVDGSVVTLLPTTVPTTLTSFPGTSFQDTRLISAQVNPYPFGTIPFNFPLISSVMVIARASSAYGTFGVGGAASAINTVGLGNMTISLPYNSIGCNPICNACGTASLSTLCLYCNLACLPTCMLYDSSISSWRLDPSLTTTSRYGSTNTSLIADCTISVPSSQLYLSYSIAVFGATPGFNGIIWPPAGYSSSGGYVASSTAAAASSTGAVQSSGIASSTGSPSTSISTVPTASSSSSTGAYVPPPTSTAIQVFFAFNIHYEWISSQLNNFSTILTSDMARASGVDAIRIQVSSIDPSGNVTTLIVNKSSVNLVSKDVTDNSTSATTNTTQPTTITIIQSTQVVVGFQVTPSIDPTAVTPADFVSKINAQAAAGSGPVYSGIFSQFIVGASTNFSTFTVNLCSDNLYRANCGTTTTDQGGDSAPATLFGFSVGIGVGIILGGIVLLCLLIFLGYQMYRMLTAKPNTELSEKEKKRIYKLAMAKKKQMEKEQREAQKKEREKFHADQKAAQTKKGSGRTSGGESPDDDETNERRHSTSGNELASPSNGGGIGLGGIEPQFESGMYVPQHLRKTAAAVTALTAGHEAPDHYEAELKPEVAARLAAAKKAQGANRPTEQYSDDEDEDERTSTPVIQVERQRSNQPVVDSRLKRAQPIVSGSVQSSSPGFSLPSPAQRAAQMERQRQLQLQQRETQLQQELQQREQALALQLQLQQQRMTAPGAYTVRGGMGLQGNGLSVQAVNVPQRLPSHGPPGGSVRIHPGMAPQFQPQQQRMMMNPNMGGMPIRGGGVPVRTGPMPGGMQQQSGFPVRPAGYPVRGQVPIRR